MLLQIQKNVRSSLSTLPSL